MLWGGKVAYMRIDEGNISCGSVNTKHYSLAHKLKRNLYILYSSATVRDVLYYIQLVASIYIYRERVRL